MVTARRPSHSTPKPRIWQETVGIAALLLAATVIYFWPQLGEGRALYWGDIGLYFTPMQTFLRENLHAGRLPLWNPLILCGTPYLGNPQAWPLYPFSALLFFVSTTYFISLTVAFHVWLGGMGTFLFLQRALAQDRGPALLGALTWMFGGWLVSKEQFPNMVQAAAYLPLILWLLHRLLTDCGGRDALALGAVLGLQLLAAHVQMTLLTLYLAFAYCVFVMRTNRRKAPRHALPLLALTGLLAGGLAAGQLLPDIAVYKDAWRQALTFHVVNRFYLPLNQIGNFLLPTLHGHPIHDDFSARGNFWETCCYVGWIPFAAAFVGVVAAWRRAGAGAARFWTLIFLFGLGMALGGGRGDRHGLYWLAYRVLPGFRSFHDPARCLLWSSFALAVLAACGLQWASERWRPHRRASAAAGLALLFAFVDLAHFGRSLYPLADPATLFPTPPIVAALQADPAFQAHQARFLAPDTARVWRGFSPTRAFQQDVPGFSSLWADTLTPNLMMPYGLPDAYGYEPVTRRDTQKSAGASADAFRPEATPEEQAGAAALAGILGVRFVTLDRVTPPRGTLPGLMPVIDEPTLAPVTQKHGRPPRTYLLRDQDWQPRARLAGRAVPFLEDTPDRVVLQPVSEAVGTLLLADTAAPGWQATRDGAPVPISVTAGFLRAVSLPQPGRHTVVFSYRPEPFALGLYLSLLTLCGIIGAAVFHIAGKRAGVQWHDREDTERIPR